MSQELILYDLPSPDPCRSWSANAWKTRLALNFKGIPYKTEWIPYIHLQEKLKATGIKPNPPGSWSEYSIPTIRLPDGIYVMDSAMIAIKLESIHPKPSLLLNPSLEKEAQDAMGEVFSNVGLCMIAVGIDNIVSPRDLDWFKRDRASRFGMTVEELERPKDADAAYAAAKNGFEKCRKILTEHKKDNGPFILGSVPCYADFYLTSTMQMERRIGAEWFERFLLEAGPELRAHYEACEKWTIKDT